MKVFFFKNDKEDFYNFFKWIHTQSRTYEALTILCASNLLDARNVFNSNKEFDLIFLKSKDDIASTKLVNLIVDLGIKFKRMYIDIDTLLEKKVIEKKISRVKFVDFKELMKL
jgi:hypothetical protein